MKPVTFSTHILTFLVFVFGTTLAAPPAPTDPTFVNTVLTGINNARRQHSAAALTWDATLASFARANANKCSGLHAVSHPFF